jgi:hypothetical protein
MKREEIIKSISDFNQKKSKKKDNFSLQNSNSHSSEGNDDNQGYSINSPEDQTD